MATRDLARQPSVNGGRATPLLWAVAVVLGLVVLIAIPVTKSGAVSEVPAKILLGLAIPLLFVASMAAMGRSGSHARRAFVRQRPTGTDAPGEEQDVPAVSDADRTYRWRYARLLALGVAEEAAILLAADSRFSIHDLERLLSAGCPLGIGLRIVRPL